MSLIQVSCAPAQRRIQQLCPNSDLTHSLAPGLIPTLLHKELVWGDETDCIKQKKKASEIFSWFRSHAMTLQAAARKGSEGIHNWGQKGRQNQRSSVLDQLMLDNITFLLFLGPTLTLLLGGRETSTYIRVPHLDILGSPHASICKQMCTLKEGSDLDSKTRLLITLRRV